MRLIVGTPVNGLILNDAEGIEKLSHIALPVDAKISIEKTSSALNDSDTSFSYAFPVPRKPNEQALGWPGRLHNIFPLPTQPFILEDQGIQVLRGSIEYDSIDKNEIGLILKSGKKEFKSALDGKKLADVDFGSEWWFENAQSTLSMLTQKLSEWDDANSAVKSPFVVAPFIMHDTEGSGTLCGNKWVKITGNGTLANFVNTLVSEGSGYYQLQFKAWYMLEKIFTSAGYTVTIDALKESEFEKLVVFTRPLYLNVTSAYGYLSILPQFFRILEGGQYSHNLHYANIMPDIDVVDFLGSMKQMMGLMYEFNELEKKVNISFIKDLFLPESLDTMSIQELSGWIHQESNVWWSGYNFELKYQSQDNKNDTRRDFAATQIVATTLPAATTKDKVCQVTTPLRNFITIRNAENTDWIWEEIGRLKSYLSGTGKEVKELPAKVPVQVLNSLVEQPILEITPNAFASGDGGIVDLSELIVSLYHGYVSFGAITVPYLSGDRYSIDKNANPGETNLFTWALKDNGISLAPDYLYTALYTDYLQWKTSTFSTKAFTKYIRLTLPQLLSLRWGKRYFIGGVQVILDKINYEHPFTGIVKVDGFTYWDQSPD